MVSFFEKLKKGMGTEIEETEKKEEDKEVPKILKSKKQSRETPKIEKALSKTAKLPSIQPKTLKIRTEAETEVEKAKPEKTERLETKEEPSQKAPQELEAKTEKWFETEGELAVDVYQTENYLVIQSAIAGVKPENLDLTLEGDRVTIRGNREKPFKEQGDYFTQECYWGPFSREIILPVEVDPNRAEAEMKEGILTIRIPKILRQGKRKISVKG